MRGAEVDAGSDLGVELHVAATWHRGAPRPPRAIAHSGPDRVSAAVLSAASRPATRRGDGALASETPSVDRRRTVVPLHREKAGVQGRHQALAEVGRGARSHATSCHRGSSYARCSSQQMLWAYKGDQVVLSSYVSTGRAGFDTPAGSFAVLDQASIADDGGRHRRGVLQRAGCPWVLYFTNRGHALHGTYWHNNFGTPMSHGCVNLPLDVAAWLYDWAPVGTPVLIYP